MSPYAGSWYPEQASELGRLLDEKFEDSRRRIGPFCYSDGLAFVTPHAGPIYSGTVAAAVYRTIQEQQPERIILLAFPHRGGLRGIAQPDSDAILTPLGEVAVSELHGVRRLPESELCDHSFEIQLPFLQKSVPRARIAPVYVGHMLEEDRRAVAAELAAEWRPGTVFVASSDFTHYGRSFGFVPFPPDGNAASRLRELDYECIDAAGSIDSALFLETLAANRSTVCGTDPIALLLDVLQKLGSGDIFQSTLDYQTSGEITGDYYHSVSYAALGYFRRASLELSESDRDALLDSASATLDCLRQTGERRPVPARNASAALLSKRGVFISLHQGDDLLGCIGNCAGRRALAGEVAHLTLAAALEDPRFRPAAQVDGSIDIEISVLTPFRRIRSADQLCVGRHGAFLTLGRHSGLLLPQVADRREWTAAEFLEALARKCMLGPHAWRDPKARLFVFEAQVFSRAGSVRESSRPL